MPASEYTQAIDVWLTMLSDWDKEEKKKTIATREKSKGKKSVATLREKMNKTISERRKEKNEIWRTQAIKSQE